MNTQSPSTLPDQNTIVFRDPPPANPLSPRREITWASYTRAFVREIAFRKGEWAVHREGLRKGSAHALASIYRKDFPHVEWVARPDSSGTGTYAIYARVLYV